RRFSAAYFLRSQRLSGSSTNTPIRMTSIPGPGMPGMESTSPSTIRVSATVHRSTRLIRSSIGLVPVRVGDRVSRGRHGAWPREVLSSVYGAECVLHWSGRMVYPGGGFDSAVRRSDMPIGRVTKIAAGIIFVVAALGVAAPVLLVPLGLAVWVFGEVL